MGQQSETVEGETRGQRFWTGLCQRLWALIRLPLRSPHCRRARLGNHPHFHPYRWLEWSGLKLK